MTSLEEDVSFQTSVAESAQLRQTYEAQITPGTRDGYRASSSHFLSWLYSRSPASLRAEFIDGLDQISQPNLLQRLRHPDPNNPPINFSIFTVETFLTWILSLRNSKTGQPLCFTTLAGHRATLRNLFKRVWYHDVERILPTA